MASSEVFVVETSSGEVHLGHLLFGEDTLTVLSGFAGRPIVLDADDVDSVVPAADHPDVVGADDGTATTDPGERLS